MGLWPRGSCRQKGKTVLAGGRGPYLVRWDRLETAAEVAEVVSTLMHLDSLPVILDFREHAVRTLLHRVLDGLAGLGLGGGEGKARSSIAGSAGQPERLGTTSAGRTPRSLWKWKRLGGVVSGADTGARIPRNMNTAHCRADRIPLKEHFSFSPVT